MRLLILSIIQSMLLAGGQVFLKLALSAAGHPSFSWHFVASQLTNWWWLGCGLCYGASTVLWFYIVKTFPLSQAYPLVAMSFVFGMLAAIAVFHEQVSAMRWAGAAIIIIGCVMIAK